MYNYPFFQTNQTNPFIVASAVGDVNGDGIPDRVYLTGTKTEDSPFIQNITLVIQDGSTMQSTQVPLKENAGYNPTVTLWNFTGSGAKEILIGITSGGSGGIMYYYIVSDLMNRPRFLFDFNLFNEKYQYDVTYRDFYKVDVISKAANTRFVIDISTRDSSYLNEIYDRFGRLRQPISGFVNPLSGLYPIDFDSDGVYELLAYQKIAGRYNADSLGYVQTSLRWKQNNFAMFDQNVAIFGTEIGGRNS